MDAWKEALSQDPEAEEIAVEPKAGVKRKAVSTILSCLPSVLNRHIVEPRRP